MVRWGGGVAAVALAVGGWLLLEGDRAAAPAVRSPSAASMVAHRNSAAGYEVRHPPRWRVSERGTVSRLISPNRTASVSFGLGPDGGLREASVALVREVERSYRRVRLTGMQLDLIGGAPAVAFTGVARNERGVGLRFQAVTVSGRDRTYQVTVFVAAGHPGIERATGAIIDSFRPGRPGDASPAS
jgi:hypothetical protein